MMPRAGRYRRAAGWFFATGFIAALLAGAVWTALPAPATGGSADSYLRLRPIVETDAGDLIRRLDAHAADRDATEIGRQAPMRLPADWADATVDNRARKAAFIRAVLPLVLAANEAIRADRQRLMTLIENGGARSAGEFRWLSGLATRYGLRRPNLLRLVQRVDTVPVSLALAQAAIESGWGRSRFAREGNALFGQWTWDGDHAMVPQQQRSELGGYGIRRFRSLARSVHHYMANLNRHRAYGEFRHRRAQLRAAGGPVSGAALAQTLEQYSEHRVGYVALLRRVIAANRLGRFDAARFASAAAFAGAHPHDRLAAPGSNAGPTTGS